MVNRPVVGLIAVFMLGCGRDDAQTGTTGSGDTGGAGGVAGAGGSQHGGSSGHGGTSGSAAGGHVEGSGGHAGTSVGGKAGSAGIVGGSGGGGTAGAGATAGSGGQAGGGASAGAGGAGGSNTGTGGDSHGGGTAFHAAPDGSGTSCTLAAPCSLGDVVDAVRGHLAGMTTDIGVYLHGGTYRPSTTLTLGPGDSGQNGHRVVYQPYPGDIPILSGAVQVTGFTQLDATSNIWRAPVPPGAGASAGRQLFVNGVRAVRARTAASPGGVAVTSTGFDTSDGAYASYGNPSRIEVVQDNDWKHMRCPLQGVTAIAGGGASLTVLPACWQSNNLSVPNVGFPMNGSGLPTLSGISWVENALELLTQPGQFYFDPASGYLYYMPREGEDPTTADVELPVLETLLSLAGTPSHLAPRNDDDPAAAYNGSWVTGAARGYGDFRDDVHTTTVTGDSVAFTFTGTGLQVLGETNSDEGDFDVYVDGAIDATKPHSQASSSRVAQQIIFSVLGLSSSAHTVKVVSRATAGLSTVIDAFVVIPEAIAPVHDVTFAGITFSHATWNLPSTVGYIDNQAGVLWNTDGPEPTATRIPAAVQVHRGLAVSFSGNTFSHLGAVAIDLADGTQDTSVTDSIIQDTSGGGISVGEVDDYFQSEPSLITSGDTLANNAIAHVGVDYHDAVGIWVGYTRTLTVQHNDIGHTPYSGMSVGWGWGWASPCAAQYQQGLSSCRFGTTYAGGNQILSNYIHDVMGYLQDGGPIYTNGGQGNGDASATSVLANNFVTVGNHSNNMLYHDEGSSYWSTHDNVTSLGGIFWMAMWTPTIHDITIGPDNYTDQASTLNKGTNITYASPTLVSDGAWPPSALAIMTAAGLDASHRPTTLLDDDDQAISYTGAWTAHGLVGQGDYEGNVHYTLTDGDSASLAFTGSGVSFIAEKTSDQGQAAWSIDGQPQGLADMSLPAGSPPLPQQVIFTSATLTAGQHVLQITKKGGVYMTVDAFQIQP